MSESPPKDGDSTRAVHGGERKHRDSSAVTTPIYPTSTFWFEPAFALGATFGKAAIIMT